MTFFKMKRAFTLIELLVVIAMILVIAGALTVSVQKARTRAMIAKATQETREMTNAILAYEQYAKNRSLENDKTGDTWQKCTRGSMQMILGGKVGENNRPIPVLFNATVTGDALLDPWGMPYEYMIDKTGDIGSTVSAPDTAAALPNYYRLTDRERGLE